jgi:quinol monooxygenase YgiN
MTESVTVIARARAKPSTVERLLLELRKVAAAAPAEPGCISYGLFQLTDDPLELMLHETWQSAEHLQAHLGAPHMQALFGLLPELLDRPADMTNWIKVV